jgi:hypothetical protein
MIKKLFYLFLIVAAGVGIWVAFALWSGVYSIYSIPPGPTEPNGTTLLVSRDEWEPMFNSPDYKPPKHDSGKSAGVTLGGTIHGKRALSLRTIVRLPYIEWCYKKSLEPEKPVPDRAP